MSATRARVALAAVLCSALSACWPGGPALPTCAHSSVFVTSFRTDHRAAGKDSALTITARGTARDGSAAVMAWSADAGHFDPAVGEVVTWRPTGRDGKLVPGNAVLTLNAHPASDPRALTSVTLAVRIAEDGSFGFVGDAYLPNDRECTFGPIRQPLAPQATSLLARTLRALVRTGWLGAAPPSGAERLEVRLAHAGAEVRAPLALDGADQALELRFAPTPQDAARVAVEAWVGERRIDVLVDREGAASRDVVLGVALEAGGEKPQVELVLGEPGSKSRQPECFEGRFWGPPFTLAAFLAAVPTAMPGPTPAPSASEDGWRFRIKATRSSYVSDFISRDKNGDGRLDGADLCPS